MCSTQCLRSNALGMLCIVISVPRRLSRKVQCSRAAIIASFDSLLKGLNARCCWRSLWSASRCGWFSICWIKLWTLIPCDRFHHRIWHTGDVEVDIFVINRKVELIHVITMFKRTNFLHFVQSSFHRFHRSIVILQDAFFFFFHMFSRSIWRTKFSLRLTNNLLGHRFPRSIFNGFRELGWLGRTSLKCFSKWMLNESSNWLMFNCRTRLIISFSPIVIVFQWDLWWWSRRQILSFN